MKTTTSKICRVLIPFLIIWAGETLTGDPYTSKLLLNCHSWWSVTVASGVVAVVWSLALAPESNPKLTIYNDPKHEFSVAVPVDWSFSKQSLPIWDHQELLLWTNPSDSKTLIFIEYTPVCDNYTSLGSFGTVDLLPK